MSLILLLTIIALIWLIFASVVDIRTKEVPDWLSYSLIIIAITFVVMNSIIIDNFSTLIPRFLGFLTYFLIAYAMYYSRQWGGGDVKLFIGLGIIFGSYPTELLNYFDPIVGDFPFFLTFFINLMIFGALYGMTWTIFLALRNKQIVLKEIKNKLGSYKKIRFLISLFSLLMIITSFFVNSGLRPLLWIIASSTFLLFYLSILIKSVEKTTLVKNVTLDTLTEGDWVLDKIEIDKNIIVVPTNTGITKENISLLKEHSSRIKTVRIKEGIPFVPSFLIALLVSLIYGNIILFIF